MFDSSAASMTWALNSARRLCSLSVCCHSSGAVAAPVGSPLLRRRGDLSTEYVEHGVPSAMKV